MKKGIKGTTIISILLVIFIFAGCEVTAEYDIRGTWDYAQYHMDSILYDNGTITFEGNPINGTWTLYNFYDVEYSGTYQVSGTHVMLIGEESWAGIFMDENHMQGTWEGEEESGDWEAVRQEADTPEY
jgi:hypothetical protein